MGNSSGQNTLKLVDTGTAAWTLPAANVTGVQTISLQNINGTAAVAGVKEVSTITLNGMANATSFVVGDLVLTNTSGAAVTGAQMATVLTGGTVSGLALSGGAGTSTRPTNYEVGTISGSNNTVTFVAQNTGATTDLAIGGTSQSGLNSVQILSFTAANTNAAGNADNTLSVTVNGVVATSALAGGTDAAALRTEISTLASAINQAAGSTIATFDGALSIIINAPRTTTISALTRAGTSNSAVLTPSFAPNVQTLELGTTAPGATTARTFNINGVQFNTGTITNTADGLGAGFVAGINTAVGRTVASYNETSNVLTINNGSFGGLAFTNFSLGSTENVAYVVVAPSNGYVAPNTANQTVIQGVTEVTSTSQLDTVDATKFVGATNFVSETSSGNVIFNGLTAAQSATKNAGSGALTAAFDGTAATGTVNISGGTTAGAVTTSGTALTTNNINSTGLANTIGALTLGNAVTTLNINATTNLTTGAVTNTAGGVTLTTVNVNGTGAVNIAAGALASTVTTINASGNSGGLTVALGDSVTQTVTGSSGNDVITTGATVLTTGSVNAGSGIDTLVLSRDISITGDGAKYTGFENLRVKAAATQDVSLISDITAVQMVSGNNAITGLTATQAGAMTARGDIGTLTAALTNSTGTADVFTMNLGTGLTTSAAANTGVLTLTGFETINLSTRAGVTSTVGAARVSTIAGFNAINANTINLLGSSFVITDLANSSGTRAKVFTVDGSQLIGNGASTNVGLTVGGNIFAGSTVIGSFAANNVFTLGNQADVIYRGGNARDSFTGAKAEIAATTIIGGTGIDTLVIADGADTIADATFAKVTGMEILTLNEVTGLSLTTGTAFNAAFSSGTVTINATALDASAVTTINTSAYTGNVTLVVTTLADTEATTLTTGDGNDTVTLTANATTSGVSTISTGAGVDTITANHTAGGVLITNTTLVIDGGAGADIIVNNWGVGTTAVSNARFVINPTESTALAYDKITGFYKGAGATVLSDTLDFSGTPIKPAAGFVAVTVVGYSAAQLQVAASTAGLLTFTGSLASTLTNQMVIDAYVTTIDSRLNNLETVAWSSASSTLVFNNNVSGDSVVELIGTTGVTAVGAAAATANLVGIV